MPYFVISIVIQVALIRYTQKNGLSFKSKNKIFSIAIAALLGMISPLPTYAAVPIGLSFIPLGIPISAVIAFIIASPLVNPSLFFLTLTRLGVEIALARVIVAFALGFIGGFISEWIIKSIKNPENFEQRPKQTRTFLQDFWRNSVFLGKYFAVALLISAVVKAMVSPQLVTEILGRHIQGSLVIAIALGVPFYSCGGAAIPFVEVLSDMGMNKGAVLAFFIAGPATKLETLYVFKSMLGIKVFVYYLLITIIGAYLAGLILLLI